MTCSVCFLVILLGAFALSSAEKIEKSLDSGIMEVLYDADINDFLRDNPEANLTQMEAVRGRNTFDYTFGRRARGDYILFTISDSVRWPSPHYSWFRLKYNMNPDVRGRITFLKLAVERTSNQGQAYITQGGIGQRGIVVYMEALHTVSMAYAAHIYGGV